MQKFAGVAQDTSGNALANPSITVLISGTATAASIFSTGVFTVLANPFTGAVDGTYQFYAGNGRYDITVAKAGFAFTAAETTDVLLYDGISRIGPPALAVTTNNYVPPQAYQALLWYLSATAAVTLTGIGAPVFDGYQIQLIVTGAFTITVTNEDAASLAGNRIITGTGASIVLPPDSSMTLLYDAGTTRWRKVV